MEQPARAIEDSCRWIQIMGGKLGRVDSMPSVQVVALPCQALLREAQGVVDDSRYWRVLGCPICFLISSK